MATGGGKTVFVVLVDFICVFIIGLPVLVLYIAGEPFQRGFFCNDETIRHPYRDSSISTSVLILVSSLLPIIIFTAVEFSLAKSSGTKSLYSFLHSLYSSCVVFLFGLAVNQMITDVIKYSIGRLRPHFMSVCQPNISAFDESVCGSDLEPKYITEFECLGGEVVGNDPTDYRVKDARLSFLSGHASMSTYAMLFAIIYLQNKLNNRNYRLVKPLIQVGCSLFTIYTSLTRISDYKHHPEDVLAGNLLGATIALLTHYMAVDKLNRNKPVVHSATSTTTLLNLPSRTYNTSMDHPADRPGSP